MQRFVIYSILLIIGYSVYHDLKIGSIPVRQENSSDIEPVNASDDGPNNKDNGKTYIYYIQPGDTVLSIIEKHEETLPVPIETVIKDFTKLNEGLSPNEIVVGDSYIFKDY